MAEPPQYSDDDIKAIIDRALERQGGAKGGGATHGDLLAIGEQIGLSAGEMEQAAREVREAKLDAEATERVRSSRKRWFLRHAAVFALLNGLLFTVNALTTPGEWWVLFSIVFWGLALGLHAGAALGTAVSPKRLRRERALLDRARDVRPRSQLRVETSSSPQPEAEEERQSEADGSAQTLPGERGR